MSNLSDKYKYVILCEDKQDYSFLSNFFKYYGINRRNVTYLPLPIIGCGEQYVREKYPNELTKLRRSHTNIVLMICTDADKLSVFQRIDALDEECKKQAVAPRNVNEPIMFLIPKRNIETWINLLDGDSSVDELTDYGHFRGMESEKGKTGKILAEKLSCNFFADSDLSSLRFLQKEFNNIQKMQEAAI